MPFPFIAILIQLAIGIGLQALGYLLMPQAKAAKSEEVTDMDNPTAEAGRPIPVVFGECDVNGINIIWFGDKNTNTREVKA